MKILTRNNLHFTFITLASQEELCSVQLVYMVVVVVVVVVFVDSVLN
jgi:hypothetical protein